MKSLPVVLVASQGGLQHTEHTQCRLHAAVEVGVAEGVAATDKQRAVEDGHLTRTVRHRDQHLWEGFAEEFRVTMSMGFLSVHRTKICQSSPGSTSTSDT